MIWGSICKTQTVKILGFFLRQLHLSSNGSVVSQRCLFFCNCPISFEYRNQRNLKIVNPIFALATYSSPNGFALLLYNSIHSLVLQNLAVAFISSFNPSQFPSFHSLQPHGFSFRSTSASHSFLSWGPRSHYSPARNTLLQFLGQHLPLIHMISGEMSPAQKDFPSSSSLVIYSLPTRTISKLFSCLLSPPLDCKLMQGRGLLNE